MKYCIIADFEWSVTPYPTGDNYFYYYNEILSAGAVRMDETGTVTDRFYTLIRPEHAAYLHPVVLSALHLSREALAKAPDFRAFYTAYRAFVGDATVFAWGCADQSALRQNLRIKAPDILLRPTEQEPKLLDLQPMLCRAYGLQAPFPGLAALLETAGLASVQEQRHNALSDAENTARIAAALLSKDAKMVPALFYDGIAAVPKTKSLPMAQLYTSSSAEIDPQAEGALLPVEKLHETPASCLRTARRILLHCPVCGTCICVGTWYATSATEILSLCNCSKHGKYLCILEAVYDPDSGSYSAVPKLLDFNEETRKCYVKARHADRIRKIPPHTSHTK